MLPAHPHPLRDAGGRDRSPLVLEFVHLLEHVLQADPLRHPPNAPRPGHQPRSGPQQRRAAHREDREDGEIEGRDQA